MGQVDAEFQYAGFGYAHCGLQCFFYPLGYLPEAMRATPPVGIEGQLLPAGSPAPPFEVAASAGPVSLPEDGKTLLIFYRGDW